MRTPLLSLARRAFASRKESHRPDTTAPIGNRGDWSPPGGPSKGRRFAEIPVGFRATRPAYRRRARGHRAICDCVTGARRPRPDYPETRSVAYWGGREFVNFRRAGTRRALALDGARYRKPTLGPAGRRRGRATDMQNRRRYANLLDSEQSTRGSEVAAGRAAAPQIDMPLILRRNRERAIGLYPFAKNVESVPNMDYRRAPATQGGRPLTNTAERGSWGGWRAISDPVAKSRRP